MIESLFQIAPISIQNIIISLYNYKAYKNRNGGKYNFYLKLSRDNQFISLEKLKAIQTDKLNLFLKYTIDNSTYYKKLYKDIDKPISVKDINKLPILNKEDLRKSTQNIYTINKKEGIISKTGGTTGKSLEVIFTKEDMQERFAMLDNFRSQFGYKLGKKTAWFSGKKLINKKDIKKNRFWKTDYLYKVRYYSTFHINDKYLKYYLENLIKYKPEYIVGFPSSLLEIAKYGIRNKVDFPNGIIKTIFPTAETITDEIRETLSKYFKAHIADQYASSEGAPFIFECTKGNLHLELQSGVFEVLDDENKPCNEGRLILTSFTTHGTPLIRYDIGDSIKLAPNKTCSCGNNNPIVAKILGRIDDYIYSPEMGKINLGNISNTLKNVHGIQKFQVIQNDLNEIIIKIIIDKSEFNTNSKSIFLSNWQDRIGTKISLKLEIVNEIKSEKSGKYRMVKNNIKHLLN